MEERYTEFCARAGIIIVNVIGDWRFDLTSEQFGEEALDYENNPEQFREVHFAKEEKRQRYEALKAALKAYCSAGNC